MSMRSEFSLEAADLVAWGGTDNGDMLLWLPTGTPEKWPTWIGAARQFSHRVVHASSTRVVFDLLTGRLRTNIFPDDFPSDRPEFHTVFRPLW
ncbi:MAG: hypothetical protein WBA97_16715 [Actinophytocola sp.]|uniref:hypothetical protein n=1 Tax=Actinophytocola sp. TaxID=1872138 RepID=UPI003C736F65